MISYILPRKPRITPSQKRNRLQWCYEHLDWSVKDWSNVIFSDESNYEVLNRKNRTYIRRFRNDRTRFEHRKNGSIKVVVLFMRHFAARPKSQSSIIKSKCKRLKQL